VAVVRSTLKRLVVLSTANPIWSAAALLTDKARIPATSDIAIVRFIDGRIVSLQCEYRRAVRLPARKTVAKTAAASIDVCRRIRCPLLGLIRERAEFKPFFAARVMETESLVKFFGFLTGCRTPRQDLTTADFVNFINTL